MLAVWPVINGDENSSSTSVSGAGPGRIDSSRPSSAVSIPSIAPNGRPSVFETQDVSGGGLSFNSRTPPPIGTELELVLDLEIDGIPSDLPLRGEVVRVQPSLAPRGPAIVGVAFRGLAAATRNALLRWIAAEETREIANQRRGPLCSVCRRPLGDIGAKMHPTCVPATTARTSHVEGSSNVVTRMLVEDERARLGMAGEFDAES